jgi:hypothetical protein
MWIHLAPLKRAPTAQVGQMGLLLSSLASSTVLIVNVSQFLASLKRRPQPKWAQTGSFFFFFFFIFFFFF